jgi:hypothetical protein
MDRSRWLTLAGTIFFLAVAVAWMLPPTTPLSLPWKPVIDRTATAHRQIDVQAATPPTVEAPSTPRPDWRNLGPVSPAPAFGSDELGASPERSAPTQAPPYHEDQEASFLSGYRWAERNDITDRADCRIWRDMPQEGGCLAYLFDRNGSDDNDPNRSDAGSDPSQEDYQEPRSASLVANDAIGPSSD